MDSHGHIGTEELNDLFKASNLPLPGYKVREIIQDLTKTGDMHDGKVTFDEFANVSSEVKRFKSMAFTKSKCQRTIEHSLIHFHMTPEIHGLILPQFFLSLRWSMD